MSVDQSPAEFALKLRRLPQAVASQNRKGIEARALVTKRYILASAATVKPIGGVKPNWVQYRFTDDVAAVRLRGGFAHLTEKGSYKKPDGWEETPKTVSARRIRNAAKKGVTLHQSSALRTPEGPRASAHHPTLRKRPFWDKGVDASRTPGHKAYAAAQEEAIRSVLR